MNHMNAQANVLVTVGATAPFSELVDAVLQESCLSILSSLEYTQLRIQHGNTPAPHTHHNILPIQSFTFTDNLLEEIANADLVISHAGKIFSYTEYFILKTLTSQAQDPY